MHTNIFKNNVCIRWVNKNYSSRGRRGARLQGYSLSPRHCTTSRGLSYATHTCIWRVEGKRWNMRGSELWRKWIWSSRGMGSPRGEWLETDVYSAGGEISVVKLQRKLSLYVTSLWRRRSLDCVYRCVTWVMSTPVTLLYQDTMIPGH